MLLSNHFHICSLSISTAANEFFFFRLSFLINVILLWCDKMPQMNRATLICISFYFHSANCDESTVSFIIKFNCGKKVQWQSECCCLASGFICVCMCAYMHIDTSFGKWSIFPSHFWVGTMYSCQLANYKSSTFNFASSRTYVEIHSKILIYLLTYSFVCWFLWTGQQQRIF